MIIPKRQMGCDSQLTVKPRKNSAGLVDIILFLPCQMHPTFRPVHPTCRIVSKWPTFSKSTCLQRVLFRKNDPAGAFSGKDPPKKSRPGFFTAQIPQIPFPSRRTGRHFGKTGSRRSPEAAEPLSRDSGIQCPAPQ